MAGVTVEINGKETVSTAAAKASDSIVGMGQKSKPVFEGLTVTAGDVANAIKAIATEVSSLFAEFAEQERALLTYNAAMKQTGNFSDETVAALRAYAEAQALRTGADDEAILGMVSFLATAGRTEEQIRGVISAASDMSIVTGKDLRTSVEEINKTFSGTEGRMGQVVLGLGALTEDELKAGAAVDVIAAQYGGLADQLSGSASVALDNFTNTVDDLKAAIGGALSEEFLPWLQDVTESLIETTPKIAEMVENALKIIPALETIGAAWLTYKGILFAVETAQMAVNVISAGFTNTNVLVLGISLIVAAIVTLIQHWEDVGRVVQGLADKWVKVFQPVVDIINFITGAKPSIPGQNTGVDKDLNWQQFAGIPAAGGAHANGTGYAPGGLSWVGERGPELVILPRGAQVIPNHRLGDLGIPGYADGTGGDGGFDLGIGSPLMQTLGPVFEVVTGLFYKLIAPLSSVQALIHPLITFLGSVMEVIGPLVNQALAPLVGIIKIVGNALGQILAPVIVAIGKVITWVAEGLIWVWNGIVKAINWALGWAGVHLSEASLASATAAGTTTTSGSVGTSGGGGAQYSGPRTTNVYVTVNTAALVGSDGMREFAIMINNELTSAGVLGMA